MPENEKEVRRESVGKQAHMGMEIEKKFTVKNLPENLSDYPFHEIEQGYLNVHPAIRVRREDSIYYMTYKGTAGVMAKEEYNLDLDETSYFHLLEKADGNIIKKKRYLISINEDAFSDAFLEEHPQDAEAFRNGEIKIELDIFEGKFLGLKVAEVEFPSIEAANAYRPADWFLEDVTGQKEYSNAHMSRS